jgi:hypothetical protein
LRESASAARVRLGVGRRDDQLGGRRGHAAVISRAHLAGGAGLAFRMGQVAVRRIVTAIGFGMAAALLVKAL